MKQGRIHFSWDSTPAHLVRRHAPRRRRQGPALVQGSGTLRHAHHGMFHRWRARVRRHGHGAEEPVSVHSANGWQSLTIRWRRRDTSRDCRWTSRTRRGPATRWKCSIPTTACCRGRMTAITPSRTRWPSCAASMHRSRSIRAWRARHSGPTTPGRASITRNGARNPSSSEAIRALQECCFVPRSARAPEGDGYLIGVVDREIERPQRPGDRRCATAGRRATGHGAPAVQDLPAGARLVGTRPSSVAEPL